MATFEHAYGQSDVLHDRALGWAAKDPVGYSLFECRSSSTCHDMAATTARVVAVLTDLVEVVVAKHEISSGCEIGECLHAGDFQDLYFRFIDRYHSILIRGLTAA